LVKDWWHAKLQAEIEKRELDGQTATRLIAYVDRLLDRKLPVIFNFEHLSRLTGIRRGKLAAMVYKTERFYRHFRIPKRSGEWRDIDAPTLILKDCQRWILREILERVAVSDCAHGFVKGRSIVTNASLHSGRPLVINIDVEDFFPSIGWSKVFNLFRSLGYSKKVCFYLTALTTLRDAMPQGAPTSPALSNLIVKHLDSRFAGLAKRQGFQYSRYADDMTFSGDGSPASIVPIVRQIVEEEGFHLNESKVRIMRSHKRQEVTGLVVNGTPSVRRSHVRWLRQQIYYLRKFGVNDCKHHTENGHKNTREFLYGHALFVRMVTPAKGNSLLTELNSVNW
jgi:retron-type reverse transcriptase